MPAGFALAAPAGLLCKLPEINCQDVYKKAVMMEDPKDPKKQVPKPSDGDAKVPQLLCNPADEASWAPECDPQCKPSNWKNCFIDEVFFLHGDEQFNGMPITTCGLVTGSNTTRTCKVDVNAAAQRVIQVLGPDAMPKRGNDAWDQVVVFSADTKPFYNADDSKAGDENGPIFYRDGDVNEVANIGLGAKVARKNPWVGIVDAGGTAQVPGKPASDKFGPCGRTPRRPGIDAQIAQASISMCAPGVYTYFDALAQASANMYGPYLKGDMAMGGELSVPPLAKGAFYPEEAGIITAMTDPMRAMAIKTRAAELAKRVNPRVWNGFLNMQGSLLGGNNFRDNGNGTFEASTEAAPDFIGTTGGGAPTRTPVFQPLDLYVMGMLPSSKIGTIEHFMKATIGDIYRPTVTKFDWQVGPGMGTRSGLAIRDSATARVKLTPEQITAANGGERSPSYQEAPHYIRQFWVVVGKPSSEIKANIKVDSLTNTVNDTAAQYAGQFNAASNVARWRRQFGAYFYRLTGWRGRVISTFEGDVDDLAYWEFGAPEDDRMTFRPEGDIQIEIPNEPPRFVNEHGTAFATPLQVLSTGGDGNGIRYTPNKHALPLRINGDQVLVRDKFNAISIRMKLRRSEQNKLPEKIFGWVKFDGMDEPIRIPNNEAAFFIADGVWRTYSANLSKVPAFAGVYDKAGKQIERGREVTGVTFIPSAVPLDTPEGEPQPAIEIEFIRVGSVEKPDESDIDCKTGKARPDGFIDSEDNCPLLYNPLQEDENSDGIGDRCEDFDGDGAQNECDNCPLISNSRQKDSDKDKVGDVCDTEQTTGCFITPDSIAGPAPGRTGTLGFGLLVGSAVGAAFMIRRRRRK